jgi:hypothetical protein
MIILLTDHFSKHILQDKLSGKVYNKIPEILSREEKRVGNSSWMISDRIGKRRVGMFQFTVSLRKYLKVW